MFAFIRKNAVKIGLTVGLVVAAAVGAAYFFPAQTNTAIAAVKSMASKAAAWVSGLFRGKPAVDNTVTPTDGAPMPEPMPA